MDHGREIFRGSKKAKVSDVRDDIRRTSFARVSGVIGGSTEGWSLEGCGDIVEDVNSVYVNFLQGSTPFCNS